MSVENAAGRERNEEEEEEVEEEKKGHKYSPKSVTWSVVPSASLFSLKLS